MLLLLLLQVLHYWPFGEPWCRIWLAVDVWMCTASIYNLVAISVDRYIAVSRPIRYASLMSPTRAKLLIIVVWILSFVICFPPLIGWNGAGGGGGGGGRSTMPLAGHNHTQLAASPSSTSHSGSSQDYVTFWFVCVLRFGVQTRARPGTVA